MVSLLFGDSGNMRLIVRRSRPPLQAPIKAHCNAAHIARAACLDLL
jgi:hypothetical protein